MPSQTRRSFLKSSIIIAVALKLPLPRLPQPTTDYSITLFNLENVELIKLPWRRKDVGWINRGTHAAIYNTKDIQFCPDTMCIASRWTVCVGDRAVTDTFRNPIYLLSGDTLCFPAGSIEILDA